MSTNEGQNVTAGNSAHVDADKVAAAALAKSDKALLGKLDKALAGAEKAVATLVAVIIEAKASNVHERTTDPVTGRPYTSFVKLLKARGAAFPAMSRVLRDAVIKELLEGGVGTNETAAVVGTSPGTVSGIANEAERAARPNDQTDAQKEAAKIANLAKSIVSQCARVNDAVQDFTPEELASVLSALKETTATVTAHAKLVRVALKEEREATTQQVPAKVAPKPSDLVGAPKDPTAVLAS